MQMLTNEKVLEDLRLWLLGLLPEQESRSLEERLITDSELYEELFIVEEELIDEYIAGRLRADERAAFESYFMNSPERQEQFRIANALSVYIGDAKETESSAEVMLPEPVYAKANQPRFRWPLGVMALAAAAVVIVAMVWVPGILQPVSPGRSLSVMLTPGGQTREGGTVQRITIPPETDTLELDLKLTRNDFQKYRATLLNSEGGTVQVNENLTGPTLRVYVRTQQTPPGEYQLKVDGVNAEGSFESVDSYRFIVQAR
jgi:hypothetical protein